jgi:hypothetical protein
VRSNTMSIGCPLSYCWCCKSCRNTCPLSYCWCCKSCRNTAGLASEYSIRMKASTMDSMASVSAPWILPSVLRPLMHRPIYV